jgi:hypothetical protein
MNDEYDQSADVYDGPTRGGSEVGGQVGGDDDIPF